MPSPELSDGLLRRWPAALCEVLVPPGETSPSCNSCCWAKAKSAGRCEREPREMSVMGGPRELSMPLLLKEAGGRRMAGERASLPEAALCGEK